MKTPFVSITSRHIFLKRPEKKETHLPTLTTSLHRQPSTMPPEAALTKKPDKDKQPEKKVGGTGSAHWDVIKGNGGKPDVLDMPVIGYQLTGTAISKGVTGVKNLMKKKESHPDPKLEGKGKRRSSFVGGREVCLLMRR